MTKKLTHLTPTMRAAIPAHVAAWIARSRRTGPADLAAFTDAARRCYEFAGVPWHNNVVRVPNPVVGALAASIAARLLARGAHKAVSSAVCSAVRSAVHSAVDSAVYSAVDSAVYSAVDSAVGSAVDSAVRSAVDSAVYSAVDSAVDSAVRSVVYSAVDSAVGSAVRSAVCSAPLEWHCWFGGSIWLYWPAMTAFLRECCGLRLPADNDARAVALEKMLAASSYQWLNRDFAMVCDYPQAMHIEQVNDGHRMHCEDGPAIGWDGWGLYSWHGTVVPEHVVRRPETITLAEIKAETNAEVRRVLRERFGEGRYLQDTGAKLIDADYEGARKGAAPRALLEDSDGNRILVGTDGSTARTYHMRVRNTINTCRAAHESLAGFDESLIISKS